MSAHIRNILLITWLLATTVGLIVMYPLGIHVPQPLGTIWGFYMIGGWLIALGGGS